MPILSDPRKRILTEVSALLLQYGIRSTSMDDIAARLGISKKTIYHYFEDKDALVEEIVNNILSENECDCENDRLASENAIHEVILAMQMMQKMFTAMNPSVVHDLQKYHPKAFHRFKKHKDQFLLQVLTKNLQRGIKEKLYRPELNVDILARFRVESTMLPFNPDFQFGLKQSLFELQQEILIHFLYGVVTPKGYELLTQYLQTQKKQKKK
ncbi:MAG: TetR/AcrR family transcriptional regulator [Ferruginibacter sp.]